MVCCSDCFSQFVLQLRRWSSETTSSSSSLQQWLWRRVYKRTQRIGVGYSYTINYMELFYISSLFPKTFLGFFYTQNLLFSKNESLLNCLMHWVKSVNCKKLSASNWTDINLIVLLRKWCLCSHRFVSLSSTQRRSERNCSKSSFIYIH